MLKIYLVRHGQDKDNEKGILNGRRNKELTEIGINQAKELALKIKEANIKFDKIYSSPLKRAYKTAEIIKDTLNNKEVEVLENLIERDFGIMSGKLISDIEKFCSPDVFKSNTITYFLNPEGSETFPELLQRAKELLNNIKNKYEEGSILLVTHGDFGKMIYASYYNIPWLEVLNLFHFGNSEMIELNEGLKLEDTHVFKIKQHNL